VVDIELLAMATELAMPAVALENLMAGLCRSPRWALSFGKNFLGEPVLLAY
jgi:hypothetical protein